MIPSTYTHFINKYDRTQYFGFVAIDSGVTDPFNPGTNYLSETQNFTNIAHLSVGTNPSVSIDSRVAAMNAVGVKAIVDISGLLFGGTPLALLANYSTNWSTFAGMNNLASPGIWGFYMVDEPYRQSLTFSDFNTGCTLVRNSVSQHMMFIEAYTFVSSIQVPLAIDYFGFDEYQIDPISTGYLSLIAQTKSKMSRPDQKIIIVMDGEWPSAGQGIGSFPTSTYQSIVPHYPIIAQMDSSFKMLLCYLWPGGVVSQQWGVRDFPTTVQSIYSSAGHNICNK